MKKLLTLLFVICMLGLNLVEHVDDNIDNESVKNSTTEVLEQETKQLKDSKNENEKRKIQVQENLKNKHLYTFAKEILEDSIPFETVIEYDEDLPEGQSITKIEGKEGIIKNHYQVKYENDEEVNRSRFYSETMKLPIDEVIVQGTKKQTTTVNNKPNQKEVAKNPSNKNKNTNVKPKVDNPPKVETPPVVPTCNLASSSNNAVQLVNEINYARCQAGVAPLKWSNQLENYAAIRAEEITVQFSHTRPDGTPGYSLDSNVINGENLYSGYDCPLKAHTAFKNSPSHLKNNLNSRFKSVAAAIQYKDGIAYWSLLFSVY